MTHISDNMLQPAELEENWQDGANCLGVDPDLFFPEPGATARPAKAICARCHILTTCRNYAIEHGERWGVWGGLSERELRAATRAAAAA